MPWFDVEVPKCVDWDPDEYINDDCCKHIATKDGNQDPTAYIEPSQDEHATVKQDQRYFAERVGDGVEDVEDIVSL